MHPDVAERSRLPKRPEEGETHGAPERRERVREADVPALVRLGVEALHRAPQLGSPPTCFTWYVFAFAPFTAAAYATCAMPSGPIATWK